MYPLIRYSTLFFLLSLCTACAVAPHPYGSYSFDLDPAAETGTWTAQLSPEPGRISLTMQQSEGAVTQLYLLPRHERSGYPLARIVMHDTDCDYGHQVTVEYAATPNEMLRRYFDTVIPWDTEFTITLQWNNGGEFLVTLEDEIIQGQAHQSFAKARVAISNQVLNVQEMVYAKIE